MKILIIAILFSGNIFGQNLIFNNSFDFYSQCPDNSGQIVNAIGWFNPTEAGTPDYYHRCNPIMNNLINLYQTPLSGDGLAAIYTYSQDIVDGREYVQTQLNSQLELNKCYLIKFHANLLGISKYSSNNLGCFLSNNPIVQVGATFLLNYSPQILNFQNAEVKDTLNWVSIQGIYNANGNENYITIGNFNNDVNTSSTLVNISGVNSAYYYIDDVSVIAISDLPNSMPAYAGADYSVLLGDSTFIGQEISNLNCTWSILGGSVIATNTSGLYVQPIVNTTYVVEQTLCGVVTYDTVTVFVHQVGVSEIEEAQKIKVFPNPSDGKLFVFGTDIINVEMLDMSGRKINYKMNQINNNFIEIECDCQNGLYQLFVVTKDETKLLKVEIIK